MQQNDFLQHSLHTFVRFTQYRKASMRTDRHAEKKELLKSIIINQQSLILP